MSRNAIAAALVLLGASPVLARSLQAFDALRLTPFFAITTDVQRIGEPSGQACVRDALITGVRIEVTP